MDTWVSKLRKIFNDATSLIAPKRCEICGRRLFNSEEHICIECYMQLPFTNICGKKGNKIERLFWGKLPICRANAFINYFPKSESSHIVLKIKYYNRPQLGFYLGKCMATELKNTDFFKGIDCIIPIPLAPKRMKERGYNQSETLAKGISSITHIPVDTHSVIRTHFKNTQTHLNSIERIMNVQNAFSLRPDHTLDNCHILLVDDILTTGATLISCGQEIAKAKNVKISILTLGLAKPHFMIDRKQENKENAPKAY